jgi:hypothetical protein
VLVQVQVLDMGRNLQRLAEVLRIVPCKVAARRSAGRHIVLGEEGPGQRGRPASDADRCLPGYSQ